MSPLRGKSDFLAGGREGPGKLGCYAAPLGGCRGKLSREHYISRVALEAHGDEQVITDASWLSAGEVRTVTVSQMVTKVLCEHHNSSLSPLDLRGSRCLSALRRISVPVDDRAMAAAKRGRDMELAAVLNGSIVERWFLKTMCGLLAGGQARWRTTTGERWRPNRTLLEVLFSGKRFESGAGLYLATTQRTVDACTNDYYVGATEFRFLPVVHPGAHHLVGGFFKVGSCHFVLALQDPNGWKGHELGPLCFRPSWLRVIADGPHQMVAISWDDSFAGPKFDVSVSGTR